MGCPHRNQSLHKRHRNHTVVESPAEVRDPAQGSSQPLVPQGAEVRPYPELSMPGAPRSHPKPAVTEPRWVRTQTPRLHAGRGLPLPSVERHTAGQQGPWTPVCRCSTDPSQGAGRPGTLLSPRALVVRVPLPVDADPHSPLEMEGAGGPHLPTAPCSWASLGGTGRAGSKHSLHRPRCPMEVGRRPECPTEAGLGEPGGGGWGPPRVCLPRCTQFT